MGGRGGGEGGSGCSTASMMCTNCAQAGPSSSTTLERTVSVPGPGTHTVCWWVPLLVRATKRRALTPPPQVAMSACSTCAVLASPLMKVAPATLRVTVTLPPVAISQTE